MKRYIIQKDNFEFSIEEVDNSLILECHENELLLSLYRVIDEYTINDFRQISINSPALYRALLNTIKSKRKSIKEMHSIIKNLLFDDYELSCYDYDILLDIKAPKHLGTNIEDYLIKEYNSIDEFIENNVMYFAPIYETMHDKILLVLENFKYIDLSIDEEKLDAWSHADSTIYIDWAKLEKDTTKRYLDGKLTIYGIRKVRTEYCNKIDVPTRNFTYFHPLRDILERKYYVPRFESDY